MQFATLAQGQSRANAELAWDRFVQECTTLLKAPQFHAMQGQGVQAPGVLSTITTDAFVFNSSMPLDDVAIKYVESAFAMSGGEIWSTGMVSFCSVQFNITDETIRLGLFEVAQDKAPDLVGGELTVIGGALIGGPEHQPADFVSYQATMASGPFPAEHGVRVLELSNIATLTMFRFIPQ